MDIYQPTLVGGINLTVSGQRNTTFTSDSGSWEYVSFTAAAGNHAGVWSAGNPTRLTVPAGINYVWLTGSGVLDNAGSGNWNCRLRVDKNGTNLTPNRIYVVQKQNNTTDYMLHIHSGFLPVVEDDYFELGVFQNSGITRTWNTTNENSWFRMVGYSFTQDSLS